LTSPKKSFEIAFLERALNVSLQERKVGETRVMEEYCWAMTQGGQEEGLAL
jgi:hypothetical protein